MENKKTVLENQELLLEINSHGGELTRIYDKNHCREVLWEADPEIWGRHSPILFPFIGKSYEGKYRFNGKEYPMTAHGFARDMEFELLSETEDSVWYGLKDTEETYKKYPFHFRLETGHRLEGNRIHVMWKVVNTGDITMYFMLGGHPAFKTPEGKSIYDFTLDFHRKEEEGPIHYQAPNEEGYQVEGLSDYLKLESGKAAIVPGFFHKALTYIFDWGQVEKLSLMLPGGQPFVTIHCKGIPYFGVWTMEETHPFVCLEPWFGRCDQNGYQGRLEDREGQVSLEPGKEFTADYIIEIHP
ncbi:MAG: aldose 1-epimerase family protein [Lachnospiraceae bacterium]|nr:aldose 1-epimerase family protein [Lachnospiraceae bacterium]